MWTPTSAPGICDGNMNGLLCSSGYSPEEPTHGSFLSARNVGTVSRLKSRLGPMAKTLSSLASLRRQPWVPSAGPAGAQGANLILRAKTAPGAVAYLREGGGA